jgi:hypothetical protein
MQYLLVIQFPEKLENSFERLIEIEDIFIEKLSELADIDGHDVGSGQMNIFIHTNQPLEIFEQIKNILIPMEDAFLNMKAAYRKFDEDDFTCLWPARLTEFKVI